MRRLLLLASAVVFVDTAFYAAITPLLPHYVDTLHLSKGGAGLLAGAYPAGTFFGALPGGFMAARLGVKPTVLIGLACMVVASVAFAFASGVVVLDAARFLQGVGGAASWAGAFAWLIGASPRERRGELIGSAMAAAIGGALLGPVLGGIADAVGPRPAFLGVAVLGALLAVACSLTPAAVARGRGRVRDLLEAVRDRRIVAGMWLTLLPGLLFGTIGVLAPLKMSALGASGAGVAAVWLCGAALEAIISPMVGRLSDRRGAMVPVRAALVGGAVLYGLLPAATTLPFVVLLLLLIAPTVGVLWAPAMALLSEGADAVHLDQGLAFALMNLSWAVGQFTGSAAGGATAQATSDALPEAILALTCAATLAFVMTRARRPLAAVGARR